MMQTRSILRVLAVLLLAACSSSGRALDITMVFDASVSDATLASIQTITIHPSGDESGAYPIVPARTVMRTEKVVYRYAPTTHELGLVIDATDAAGVVVAEGSLTPIAVSGTRMTTVTLASPVGGGDLLDASFDGSPPQDLAMPVDMVQPNPSFINATLVNVTGSSVTADLPVGAQPGTLLLAMLGGSNVTLQTLVTFTPPAGWTQLTSQSPEGTPSTTTTWFWHYVTAGEPASYVFGRSDSGPIAAYIAAYAGTVGLPNGGPFEGTMSLANDSSTTAMFPAITATTHDTLVVVNGFTPDELDDSWSIPTAVDPTGLVLRQSTEFLSADVEMNAYGEPFPSVSSTLSTASRTTTLAVALRGAGTP